MAWFRNRYVCPMCQTDWEDEWSALSDDTCPECDCTNVTPVGSDDLCVITVANPYGDYDVLVSACDAHDHPAYRLMATIPSDAVKAVASSRIDDKQ